MKSARRRPTLIETLDIDVSRALDSVPVGLTQDTFRTRVLRYLTHHGINATPPENIISWLYEEAIRCIRIITVLGGIEKMANSDLRLCSRKVNAFLKQLKQMKETGAARAKRRRLESSETPMLSRFDGWVKARLWDLEAELSEAQRALEQVQGLAVALRGHLEIESYLLMRVDARLKLKLESTTWKNRRSVLRAGFASAAKLLPGGNDPTGSVPMRISRAKRSKALQRMAWDLFPLEGF